MPVKYRDQLAHKQTKGPKFGPILPFLLPLPLLVVIGKHMISGEFIPLLSAILALTCFWTGAYFLKNARYIDWYNQQRKWRRASRTPWRRLAALVTATGVAVVSGMLLENNLFVTATVAILGYIGVRLRYGTDPQFDKAKDVSIAGVTSEELIEILEEAETNLEEIEQASAKISNLELKSRLNRITEKTRNILNIIEADPKDLRRARKFLKVYLTGAKKVSSQYAKTHKTTQDQTLETNFRNVLVTIEDVIEEQTQKLTENDILDLDVKIEVLQAQLKNEGVI